MAKKEENELKKEILKEAKIKAMAELDKEIKNSLVKNIEKYKEELKEEISNEINEEVINAVKREEKRLLRSKNFSILKKNIIILALFALVCYFGYCLYDAKYFDFMKSDCEKNGTCVIDNKVNSESIDTDVVVKDKDWYIENYGYLLGNANVSLSADQASAYYLYSNDHKLSEIKTSYLLNLAYKKIPEKSIKTNSVSVTISADDLKKAYQELFGTLDGYKDTTFTYNCLNFVYKKDKDKYVADNNKCALSNKEILEVITDMYEEDNKLYILTNATIYDKSEESYYTFDNLFDPILLNVTVDDLEKNIKKLNKYQYIYKKVDNNYYLDSITKLK